MEKVEDTENKIYSPILVLYSENDEISDIPETSEKILEVSSSKTEFINFPCCKHFLPLEAPDKVTETISQWFDKFK
jgi:pimeloyl-ACP methyl ester carboxylesterase